jgi:hypothetical protein
MTIAYKSQQNKGKFIFFRQYFFSAVRPPNFPGQSFFYPAGFVLFCRIFGRLATVLKNSAADESDDGL